MKQSPTIIRVRAADVGCELIDFIARNLKISKNKAKTCIDSRRVFVNGRRVWMARHKLRLNDEVRPSAGTLIPTAKKSYPDGKTVCFEKSRILFQDNNYLIVNKPPGINTNGAGGLEHLLRTSFSGEASDTDDIMAAHRLDRDTTGCIIFARNKKAKDLIIPVFAGRSVIKIYHAIVLGKLAERELALTKPLNGQLAVTLARVLDFNKQATHLLIKLETGRTHQIRKHFSAIRHPVAGDTSYNTNRSISETEQRVPRQMLHAFRLVFKHPFTGDVVRCEAPLPKDFEHCLKSYGLK